MELAKAFHRHGMMNPYSFLALSAIFVVAFVIALLAVAWLWAGAFSSRESIPFKTANHECALDFLATGYVQPPYMMRTE